MKFNLLVSSFAIALATLIGTATAADTGTANRDELTRAVVQKWASHVDKAFPIGADAWAVEMAPAFAGASLEELRAAAGAKTFDDMNKVLLGGTIGDGTQALGDAAADLVYVPVTPCRIFDTRLAGGQIAANTVRSFDVTAVSDYSFQGGAANNCGVGAAGSFAAAEINFTVVAPGAPGFITAFPFLATQPLAATVNYTAGAIVGNDVVVKLDQGASANELSVFSFAQTHLVGDIVGYYITPAATQLDCVEVTSAGVDIGAGGTGTQSTAACPTSYEITGGSCSSSTFDGRIVTSRTIENSPTNQTHFCAFRNEGAGPANFIAYARCCRVPGR